MAVMDGKTLGVIGGMGPLATDVFYRMVIDNTKAERDQDHVNMIILNHSSMPDRTAAINSGDTKDVTEKLVRDAEFLEQSGACCIAIPCNTSHSLLPYIEEAISIPVINMIREAAAAAKDKCRGTGSKVGVMATDGTIRTGLYTGALRDIGLEPVIPSAANQKRIMRVIYEGVKAGKPVDPLDFEMPEAEFVNAGCECAILGCTELSAYRALAGLSDYFVDAMEVVARKAIVMCGKELR
ncbi:MAG: amino acid racemase [Eubacteriaceae bacterium]|jgi:aspartate racemase|nr:amino acid racemase [Eubacteriaceae bacterium]